MRSLPSLGMTVAAHCGALGKAVLAASPAPSREVLLGPEPFERLTENTITSRSELDTELERTRQRGYAIDEEESETGLTRVAAVVRSIDGRPSAAMSVPRLSERMHLLDLTEPGKRVQAHCTNIEAGLRD